MVQTSTGSSYTMSDLILILVLIIRLLTYMEMALLLEVTGIQILLFVECGSRNQGQSQHIINFQNYSNTNYL
jgi:hypothetical protein